MSVVYFIQAGANGPIKIGTATDLPTRIATLQTGCPEPLVILGTIPGDLLVEGALHRALSDHRYRGEWFHPTGEVLEVIERAKGGDVPLLCGHRAIIRRVGANVIAQEMGLSIHTVRSWAHRGRIPATAMMAFLAHGWADADELMAGIAPRKSRAA